MPNLTPLEKEEAYILADWLRLKRYKFTHIPNESSIRNPGYFMKMQKMGKSSGVPDYMIILPGIGLLFVELKRIKGGKASEAQLDWIDALNRLQGVEAVVCKGAQDAINYIEDLLKTNLSLGDKGSNEQCHTL